MTRTHRKFAATIFISMLAATAAPYVSAVGIHPPVVPDRHPPGMFGPAQLFVDYSDELGVFIDPKYINNIGPYDALSLEFGFGAKQFRGAFTWGHILAPQHMVKVSVEYFAQEPTFSFFAEQDTEWVGQKGLGIDYMFLPENLLGIYSFHIGVLYTSAECESLKPLPYMGKRNLRRIAGARDYGLSFGFSFEPWTGAHWDLEGHHDSVKYFNKNKKQETLVGPGATIAYHQRFGHGIVMTIEGTDREPYYEYIGRLTTLVTTAPGSKIEMYCQYMLDSGPGVPTQKENRYGMGINYSWGGNKYRPRERYDDPLDLDLTDKLVEYANKPAVRPPQVFARVDERVTD